MKLPSISLKRGLICAALTLAIVAGVLLWRPAAPPPPALRDLPRSALDLRDGVLYGLGEAHPFEGRLVENYPGGLRKLVIEVRAGRLHGRSLGWYPTGQMEVEEQFVAGVSHGPRTRWYGNGSRRSLAQIENGKVTGAFTEWHENGRKAVEMTLLDGQPDGLVNAWHPSGAPKSRLRYEAGRPVEKEFWKDPATELVAASPGP